MATWERLTARGRREMNVMNQGLLSWQAVAELRSAQQARLAFAEGARNTHEALQNVRIRREDVGAFARSLLEQLAPSSVDAYLMGVRATLAAAVAREGGA